MRGSLDGVKLQVFSLGVSASPAKWKIWSRTPTTPFTPTLPSMNRQSAFNLAEILIVAAIVGFLAAVAIPSILKARAICREMTSRNNQRQLEARKQLQSIGNRQAGPLKKSPDGFELFDMVDRYNKARERKDWDEAIRVLHSPEYKWAVTATCYYRLKSGIDPLLTKDDLATLEGMTGVEIRWHGDLYAAMKRNAMAREFVTSGIELMEPYPESIKSSWQQFRIGGNSFQQFSGYSLYVMTLGRSDRFDRPSQIGKMMGVAALILITAVVGRRVVLAVVRRRKKQAGGDQVTALDAKDSV